MSICDMQTGGAYLVRCRLSGLEASSDDDLWQKVKQIPHLYDGRTYKFWQRMMTPFSDNEPEECPDNFKWAFEE